MDPEGRNHVEQFGVRDTLATPEQLSARSQGRYDPRDASGGFVATRVKLHCARCGAHLGNVVEFELRTLFFARQDARWRIGPGGMKCPCFGSDAFKVDLTAIEARVEVARNAGKPRSMNIGHM